jgi:alkylation response protein AidB-like acyl-CoA dehydrogenase
MDLALTEDQQAIQELYATFLAKECPTAVVRDAEPLGFAPALWDRLGETGVASLGLSGGVGLSELVVVAEEMGRAAAPVPFVEHTVAARLLERTGALTDDVADGRAVATLALPYSSVVPAGAVARVVVARAGEALVVVRSDPPGFSGENHASMPIAERSLDGAERIGPASPLYGQAVEEWRILTAGALVGLAARALEIAVEYVKSRSQFGVPIGSFQAIQHLLADLPGLVDGSRLLAHKAAWAADAADAADSATAPDPEVARLAAMAFLFATETAQTTTARSLHVHGGYGYAEEYDIQLYQRRARGWPLVLDDPAREYQRLADLLLGPRGT